MAGALVKRAARQPFSAEAASKSKAKYQTGPPLRRVSMATAQQMSTPSGHGADAMKLMDQLADQIQDSLTKLLKSKQGPSSMKPPAQKLSSPVVRMERKAPVGKHPAEKMMESSSSCENCGRANHRTEECFLPKQKRCYNCLKVATHKAKDCIAQPASSSQTPRPIRGAPRGRSRATSGAHPVSRPPARRPSQPATSRGRSSFRSRRPVGGGAPRGRPSDRGHPSVRGRPSEGRPSDRGHPSVRGRSSRGRSSLRGGPPSSRSAPRSFSPPSSSFSPQSRRFSPPGRFPPSRSVSSASSSRGPPKSNRMAVPTCAVCGNRGHPSNECIKRKSACHVCKKTGHLAAVCRFNR